MVTSQALVSSAVGVRPTPKVGSWASHGNAVMAITSRPAPAATSALRMNIVDAPVGGHLPALDGVVEIVRVHATDLDQLGERGLDVARLVRTPRLQNRLAPVPSPVEPEAGVGEGEDGCLEVGDPPRPSAVRRHLDPADQPSTRPRKTADFVKPRTP